ncbi:hypothetical protein PIB30_070596 [Stylosanthes scabra]|uniref:Uncharacterized protein n=1 Tax=Stylosanthes scabra TaxID=79078 RepID=A0ABU6QN40_9FABA|nr:hypothetical protein [Stylosanthes scabra]
MLASELVNRPCLTPAPFFPSSSTFLNFLYPQTSHFFDPHRCYGRRGARGAVKEGGQDASPLNLNVLLFSTLSSLLSYVCRLHNHHYSGHYSSSSSSSPITTITILPLSCSRHHLVVLLLALTTTTSPSQCSAISHLNQWPFGDLEVSREILEHS